MSEQELDQLLNRLVQKLVDEGYLTTQPQAGGEGETETKVDVKVTDKSVDFLGFKTLKDLLGSLGRASFGAHDTRDLATGVETSGAPKIYEFGDTLNLDITATLSSAIQREGLKLPLNIEYSDLQVHQCEYQSSCATVLMLDGRVQLGPGDRYIAERVLRPGSAPCVIAVNKTDGLGPDRVLPALAAAAALGDAR
jgi:Ca-activated chloride channel family protein